MAAMSLLLKAVTSLPASGTGETAAAAAESVATVESVLGSRKAELLAMS